MLQYKSKKIYKKSKAFLSTCFLLFFLFTINARAKSVYSTKINLNLVNAPLEKIISNIENQSNFIFFYQNNTVNLNRLITIRTKNESIENVLLKVFKNKNVVYKIVKNQISLKKTTHIIKGVIKDRFTGKAIPFCNITLGDSYNGTSSNEQGEFVITVKSIPEKLTFSHLNYENISVEIENTGVLNIKMTPLTNMLDEIVLKPSNEKDDYAISLAKKAFFKTNKLSNVKKYGKAFYRQKSKNGEEFSELSEIIYDVKYNSSGIKDWEIIEGRYAVKEEKINNKNFTLFSKILQALQPYTDDLIFPLRSDFESFYKVRVIDMIKTKDSKIAVIYFKPLKQITTPILEGEIYLDVKTSQILKVTGTLKDDNFKSVKFTEINTYKKNYSLTYEMVFKDIKKNDFVLDYIKVDQEFDYFKDNVLKSHVSSTSNLTFFEHYTPLEEKKLGSFFVRSNSDWENLNNIGYNKKFWKDNPIIKRTPVEDNVIDAFEKNNSFESIFLNSREQVSLIQSKLIGNPLIKKIDTLLRNNNNYNPIEKVYLHLDKNIVSVGDDIWFSTYNVLGPNHYYSNASKVVYVDLISPENKIVLSKQLLVQNGKGRGNIEIPKNLKSGIYQLRSYTRWMRNSNPSFFYKNSLKIINPKKNKKNIVKSNQKIDLQFFPEGGNSIVNINSKLAFKAINSNGVGVNVKGEVINSKGENIALFKSQFQGAGVINFKPLPNEKYFAVLTDNSTYPINKISSNGYSMLINNINKKSVKIKIQASKELLSKPFYVIGTIRNNKYYQGKFDFRGKPSTSLEIPKSKLPSGVLTITVFDHTMKPWAERIVFINKKESLIVNAKVDKTQQKEKKEIKVNINVRNTEGRPVSTNLSLSISNLKNYKKNVNSRNITSYLLLESEIKGHIKEPGFYFNDNNRSTKFKLDLIMLTNGWRRFNWMNKSKKNSYSFEKGKTITGLAKTMNNKVLKNSLLKIIAINEEQIQTFKTQTNINGKFMVDEFNFRDSTKVIFNLPSNKKNPLNVRIKLDLPKSINKSLPESNYFNYSYSKLSNNELKTYKAIQKKKTQDSISNIDPFLNTNTTILNEVKITSKIKPKTNTTPSLYGVKPDATIYPNTNTGETLISMISSISGVHMKNIKRIGFDDKKILIRGNDSPPIWIVDGVEYTVSGGSVPNININNIERIEVLKSSNKAAIYGPRAKNGVILLYTKKAQKEKNLKNIFSSEFNIAGYEKSKEFYSPKYVSNNKLQKDNSVTLYWNPLIETDKNGNASIIFNCSNTTTNLQLVIDALSEFGSSGSYIKSF